MNSQLMLERLGKAYTIKKKTDSLVTLSKSFHSVDTLKTVYYAEHSLIEAFKLAKKKEKCVFKAIIEVEFLQTGDFRVYDFLYDVNHLNEMWLYNQNHYDYFHTAVELQIKRDLTFPQSFPYSLFSYSPFSIEEKYAEVARFKPPLHLYGYDCVFENLTRYPFVTASIEDREAYEASPSSPLLVYRHDTVPHRLSIDVTPSGEYRILSLKNPGSFPEKRGDYSSFQEAWRILERIMGGGRLDALFT